MLVSRTPSLASVFPCPLNFNSSQGSGRRALRRRNNQSRLVAPPVPAPAPAPAAAAASTPYADRLARINVGLQNKMAAIRDALAELDEVERVARSTGLSPNRAEVRDLQNAALRLLRGRDIMAAEAEDLRIIVAEEGGAPPAAAPQEQPELPPSMRRRILKFDA